MADQPPARPTWKSIEEARRRAHDIAAARRAERLKATRGVSYEEAHWQELSPFAQAKVNKLPIARGQTPLSPAKTLPKPEKYVAAPEQLRPFDPNDPEAIAAALEFRGYGDQAEEWKKIAKRLAIGCAQDQLETQEPKLTKRELNKEILWRAIAKFVDAAKSAPKDKRWHRKRIIGEACDHFGVGRSTVEEAIKQYRKEFHFTDGSKLSPAK
jgi:hypothetical protein